MGMYNCLDSVKETPVLSFGLCLSSFEEHALWISVPLLTSLLTPGSVIKVNLRIFPL